MTTQYIPFVTDFGARHEHLYSPFVTDFGRSPVSVQPSQVEPVVAPVQVSSGLDWSSVALGGAMGIAFAVLLVAAFLVLRARLRTGARATA
jgi:hypothetical protein